MVLYYLSTQKVIESDLVYGEARCKTSYFNNFWSINLIQNVVIKESRLVSNTELSNAKVVDWYACCRIMCMVHLDELYKNDGPITQLASTKENIRKED